MANKFNNAVTVEAPIVQENNEIPRVRVFIPLPEEASSGVKYDPYEHVTINGETTLVRRGEHLDVTVPVFVQLRNKYPNL